MTNRSMGFVRTTLVATTALAVISCSRAPAHTPPSPSPTSPARPAAGAAAPAAGTSATATIRDLNGARVGTATLTDTYSGVLIVASVMNVGLGAHGIHIHGVGKCEPPFTSAGPHFNPLNKQHGFENPNGPHLGDLPNIDTPAAGALRFEVLLPGVTLKGVNPLLDADGAAIVVHAARDDYKTNPAGDSGSRIACGVIAER